MNELLYGVAYYDEYMPYERLQKDMEMMRAANINVIRIAESTWASEEPENGVFNFTHVERALRAAQAAGISVIVGTPTYAVPPWLAAEHPEIIAVTPRGQGQIRRPPEYGHHLARLPLPRGARDPQADGMRAEIPERHWVPARQRDEALQHLRPERAEAVRRLSAGEVRHSGGAECGIRLQLLEQPHRLLGERARRDRHDQLELRGGVLEIPAHAGR